MRLLLPGLLILILAGGVVHFYLEAAAAGRQATRLHAQLATLRGSLAAATADLERAATEMDTAAEKVRTVSGDRTKALASLAATQASWDDARKRVSYLEKELRSEVSQRKDVDEVIEQTTKALREERLRHNKEIWEAKKYMPEGVRQALISANELLREDGQLGLRFLKAMKIEKKVLHKVQLLDRDATSLAGTIYIADELTFDLDRMTGSLTLCFRDGYSRGPYGREQFPMSGKRVVLPEVSGRRWESRLPFLVQAHGEYPVEDKKARLPLMETTLRRGWLRRVNALLEKSTTETRYRLETFRNIDKAKFAESLLLGYDDGKKLAMSADAAQLWLQVDTLAKTVEIWVADGTLRKVGGETPIPKGGYRIRLPGVQPSQAIEAMLGMVKRK